MVVVFDKASKFELLIQARIHWRAAMRILNCLQFVLNWHPDANFLIVCHNCSFYISFLGKPFLMLVSQIARSMGPTWDLPGSCRPQMGPMWIPWTLLSGNYFEFSKGNDRGGCGRVAADNQCDFSYLKWHRYHYSCWVDVIVRKEKSVYGKTVQINSTRN